MLLSAVRPLSQPLFNGVLMRTAKSRENQFSGVRVPLGHGHAGATLVHLADGIQIGEVQLRIDSMHVQVQRHRHQVKIARAFAIAEKRAFDAVRSGQQPQFSRRHPCKPIVVRVQADDERLAVFDVPANPFDLIGIHIRHGHFHRVRQVQNHLALRCRFPNVHDRFRNFLRKLDLRAAKTLGRILQHDFGAFQPREPVLDQLGAAHRYPHDLFPGHAKHNPPLCWRRRIIEMDNCFFGPGQRLERALDQFLARLHEHLKPDILRRAFLLY